MNVFGYNPKAWSKHAFVVDSPVACDEHKMGQVFIVLIHQVIEMKGLDHHLLCSMHCYMKGVLVDDVPKFLAPIPSKTMHVT